MSISKSPRGRSHVPTVIITFLDDEIMEGRVQRLNLDEPDIVLQLADGASNNERALIPLPSIKRVTLESIAPGETETALKLRKVAIRFRDGEVLTGYLAGELQHAAHGLTLHLMTVKKDRLDTLAIPYTAIKALFYLKSWDSRPPEFNGEVDRYLEKRLASPLVDLVSNIGQLQKLRKRGAITESEFQRKRRKILDKI